MVPKPLTPAEFDQLNEFIERGALEIELSGENIVLFALQPAPEGVEGEDMEEVLAISIRDAARDKADTLAAEITTPGDLGDPSPRANLLTLAGYLREGARIIENKAESLTRKRGRKKQTAQPEA